MRRIRNETEAAAAPPADGDGQEGISPARQTLKRAMEALTLVLAVALPVTLSPFAEAYFEVPKAFFLRTVALAQAFFLTAWAVCLWREKWRARRSGSPWAGLPVDLRIVYAALGVAAISLLSAFFAINRGYAFVGCPQRGGGALSVIACVILFAAAAVAIRRREQVERIVAAWSLGCVPCVVFLLSECAGAHPMGFPSDDPSWRPAGPFGNANFLGSFFALAAPLAIGAAWAAWRRRRVVAAGVFGVLALAVTAGIWLSQSRGPILALLAGCGVSALLLLAAAGYGRWARRLAKAGIAVVGLALLAFHFFFVSPMRAGWSGAGSQSGVLRTGSVAVRLHIYRALSERMLSSEPIRSTFDTVDPLHAFRFWIGYGPQNLMAASERYFSSTLENLERDGVGIDTAHCLLLEVWAESGVLGVAAWCGLFLFAVISVTRALGLARDRQTLWRVCGMIASGAALGALLLALFWGGWAWGFGFAVGTIAGVLYAVQWLCRAEGAPPAVAGAALAPATALLVFLFDAQMGVLTVSAAAAAWLLLGIAHAWPHRAAAAADEDGDLNTCGLSPALIAGLALTAAVAANAGLQLNHRLSASLLRVWADIVFSPMGLPGLATVAAGLLLIGDAARWRRAARLPAAVLACGWLADVTLRSLLLARAFGSPLLTADAALAFASTLTRFEWLRYLWLALCCGLLAAASDRRRTLDRAVAALLPAAALAAAAAILFAWPRSGAATQGALAAATFFEESDRPDLAGQLVWRAIGNSVWDDVNYARLHRIYGEAAQKAFRSSPQAGMDLFKQSERMLALARQAAPYDPHRLVGYGRFHQLVAKEMKPGSEARRRHAHQAIEMFRAAAKLAPGRSSIRLAIATTYLDLLHDNAAAERELVSILDDDPQHARACETLAYLCLHRGKRETEDAAMQAAWLQKAGAFAKRALESPWRHRHGIDAQRLSTIVRGSAR